MFKKHLLYLTNDALLAVTWRLGRTLQSEAFAVDEAGRSAFAKYLADKHRLPSHLLTDLIEQDFRLDLVPHVSSRDRSSMLERKLTQVYRATPYRHAVIQGRDSVGRRDDRVLYTAITNSALVGVWTEILNAARVPLIGIYSAPILSGRLLKALKITAKHVLLVTLHRHSGLRQSYFQDGQIKFSRLIPIGQVAREGLARLIAEEARKTWQYLDSLRNFEPGETLQVCSILHRQDAQPSSESGDAAIGIEFNRLDIGEVAAAIRLRADFADSEATALLLHLLGQGTSENHFAQRGQMRYARLWRIKQAMHATSALVAAGAVSVGAANLLDSRLLSADIESAQSQARSIEQERVSVARRLPRVGVDAEAMTNTVSFYRSVVADVPDYGRFLRDLSRIMDRHPKLSLSRVSWHATFDPAKLPPFVPSFQASNSPIKSLPAPAPAASASADGATSVANPAKGYVQVIALEGEIRPFAHDYRDALGQVEQLIAELRRIPGTSVTPVVLPLDPGAGAILRGKAVPQLEKGEARFALKAQIAGQAR